MPVEDQEHVRGEESDPLVPVHERMILDESEPVGGREYSEVGIGFVPPSMLGASECRVQQAFISKPELTAVGPNLVGVRCLDRGTRDPDWFLGG